MEPETAVSKMEEIQFNLFLHNLRDEEKRLYRKYEKTYFRIITTTKAIAFTENCIREKLCPKILHNYTFNYYLNGTLETVFNSVSTA